MILLQFCLLSAVFVQVSCSWSVTSEYLLDTILLPGARKNNFENLAKAVYKFTINLHKKILVTGGDENIFFSPTSIYVALAMLYAGSEGETKQQLASALHLKDFKTEESFYQSIKALHKKLDRDSKKCTLEIANRLFGQKGRTINKGYLKKTKDTFRAKLKALDFKKDSSGSRMKINKWVERMTSGKILKLFPEETITRDTVLALANAVYFNGSWRYNFDERKTKAQTFNVSGDQEILVPMMHRLFSKGLLYAVSEQLKVRLLELPYSDEDVSMIIALGDGKDDFNRLLTSRIADSPWSGPVKAYTNVSVRLSMPRFSLQQGTNLRNSLEALGIKNLFERADLSGIIDSAALELSVAFHMADIAVDEKGTEAAGTTGFSMVRSRRPSSKEEIVEFVVDREFLLLLVEKTTGCILFFGQIKNPLTPN